jgi:hypothetical protein
MRGVSFLAGLLSTVSLVLPVGVVAQSRGVSAGMRGGTVMAGAPVRAVGVRPAAGRVGVPVHASRNGGPVVSSLRARPAGSRTARGGQVRSNNFNNRGSDERFNSSDFSGVPGLGFDFVHEAAVHPNSGRGRHDGRNNSGVLFPFFGGGYGGDYGPTEGPTVNDGQVDAQQQSDDEDENMRNPERTARGRRAEPAPQVAMEQPAPQVDVPEYVFVRRDGTVFFAVAYTWDGGALRYVSSEGLRKSVAREKLDLGATQQFNEQRGMIFRAPA